MIGDWLVYGMKQYGESLWGGQVPHGLAQEVAHALGMSPSTLWVYKHVCDKVEPFRRRKGISMQHALEVVSRVKTAKEQDAWFERIVAEKVPVKTVRAQLRDATAAVKPEDADSGAKSILEIARQFVRDFNAAGDLSPKCKEELYRILTPVMDRLT